MDKKQLSTDVLVIGSGIAGLTYAIKMADFFQKNQPNSKVTIVTKSEDEESNTKYAQGGIAAVVKGTDSFDKHIKDTLVAGDGLCDEDVVRMVVEEGPQRIEELIEWGAQFDKDENGKYHLAKEGGHSDHRILHHKDITGYEIQRVIIDQVTSHPNIEILEHHFAIDLITEHHLGKEVKRNTTSITCFGAYVLDSAADKILTVNAKITILATGGAGQVYENTTNPIIATGDGVAMAYRAKAEVKNMEFIQFHPTSKYNPDENPSFLISEAVRGAGGILRNHKGYAFMADYDVRKDLAPRDIVARAIDSELKRTGDRFVFLDTTHINKEELVSHFPTIYQKCLDSGIDISKSLIPVVPAAHYNCGGVLVDGFGQSSVNRLFCCGETSCTGLHGANRLASNSLLEAVVYSHRAFLKSVELIEKELEEPLFPNWEDKGVSVPNEHILIAQTVQEVKSVMSNYVGIVRSDERLKRALKRLELLYSENEDLYRKSKISQPLCEVRNLINVAYLIIKYAMNRKENVGLHYSLDFVEE